MVKIFKVRLLITALIFIFGSTAMADVLTYRSVLQQAVNNSFDLKISKLDIDISKADLKSARSDLYPMLTAQANSEYNNGLGNPSNINYVGNTVVSSYNQYRNLAFLGLQYNLFDFGARGKKILIAKKDVDQKQIALDLQLKDLKLKVLDLYTKTLQYNEEIKTKTEILKVYEDIFHNKERLFQAGVKDKISVMDEAVKIARTQDDIANSRLELKNALNDLASYTRQKYQTKNLEVLDFEEMNIPNAIVPVNNFEPLKAKVATDELDLSFNSKNSLEAKYYDFEIEKKKAELDLYKRQRLPSFKFYTNYLLYGQDPNQYFSAMENLKQTSVTIGISGTYTIFDGFKNRATCQKAALEMKRLQLEKEKKLNELETAYEKSYASYTTYSEELSGKKDMLNRVKEKLSALNRMSENGMAEKNDILTTKADLLSQEFELEKNIVDISSKIKEIEIMAGRDEAIDLASTDVQTNKLNTMEKSGKEQNCIQLRKFAKQKS